MDNRKRDKKSVDNTGIEGSSKSRQTTSIQTGKLSQKHGTDEFIELEAKMSAGKSTPQSKPRKIEKGTPTKQMVADKQSKLSTKAAELLDMTLKKHGKMSTVVSSPSYKSQIVREQATEYKPDSESKPYPKAMR